MNNRPEQWRERLEAEGGDPQFFVLMGQTLGRLMDLADKGLAPAGAQVVKEQAASFDWGKASHNSPAVLTQVARNFDPTMGAELPSAETASELRETMNKAQGIMERVDSMTDQRTGFFTDEAMQSKEVTGVMDCVLPQLGTFLVELKVATDHVLALMTWKTTMRELLVLTEAGDDAALCKVLSVNPFLTYHAAIARRSQQAIATQDHRFLSKLQQAIQHRPPVQKNAKAGFILFVLWEAGLKYLRYSQIHECLQVVGLHRIPSPQALARYALRLGLKKNTVEYPRTRRTPGSQSLRLRAMRWLRSPDQLIQSFIRCSIPDPYSSPT